MGAIVSRCRLVLDTRRAKKDGTYPVKISVPCSGLLLSTGVSVEERDWVKEHYVGQQSRLVNSRLNSQLARVSGRLQELQDVGKLRGMEPSKLRRILLSDSVDEVMAEDGRLTFYDIADRFIPLKESDNTKVLYSLTVKKVREFSGVDDLHIEDMDRLWLTRFDNYIGGKINARGVHLRNLRAICNFALDEEYTSYYPFRKFKIRKEETRKKALTLEQLRWIRGLHCEPWQEEYRDMFMLMFYFVGVNSVDLFTAKKDAIRNGRFEYRRSKTGRLYSIKVEPEALRILKKYRGEEYLLSPLDRYSNYRDYMHHLNNALKTLGMVSSWGKKRHGQAIEPELSCNWARHTWATMAAELDVPDPTISLALGHGSAGHRTTAIYIKRNNNKIDEANRLVIDYCFKV